MERFPDHLVNIIDISYEAFVLIVIREVPTFWGQIMEASRIGKIRNNRKKEKNKN